MKSGWNLFLAGGWQGWPLGQPLLPVAAFLIHFNVTPWPRVPDLDKWGPLRPDVFRPEGDASVVKLQSCKCHGVPDPRGHSVPGESTRDVAIRGRRRATVSKRRTTAFFASLKKVHPHQASPPRDTTLFFILSNCSKQI